MHKRKILLLFIVAAALFSRPVVANAEELFESDLIIEAPGVIPENNDIEFPAPPEGDNINIFDNNESFFVSEGQSDQVAPVSNMENLGVIPDAAPLENQSEGVTMLFNAPGNEITPVPDVHAAPENAPEGQPTDQLPVLRADFQPEQNQPENAGAETIVAERAEPEPSLTKSPVVLNANPAEDNVAVLGENEPINPDPVSYESSLPSNTNPADNSVTTETSTAGPLDQLLEMPNNFYNQDLAVVAAELSNKAYSANGTEVASYLKDMGFKEENISSYNYDGSYAYTLATKDYTGKDSDGNTDILVMDARGSVTVKELLSDAITRASYDYLGYKVYGVVDTFFKEIEKNVKNVIDETKNYKILATGHSLGGAVANLFSAVMTQNPKNQVYGYTFGAIDSIATNEPVEKGYENIHNIYNDYDTFSPDQYGSILVNGAGSKYGKFGHLDSYSVDHRTDAQKKQYSITQIYNHVNHEMKYYVEDVKNKKVECDLAPGGNDDDAGRNDRAEAPRRDIFPINNETSDNSSPAAAETVEKANEEPYMVTDQTINIDIQGEVSDSEESFSEFAVQYAKSTGATVLYSSDAARAEGKYLKIASVTTIKDADGHVYVVLDVFNTSDGTITLGLNSISVNGNKKSVSPWRSEPVHSGKHIMITVPVDGIATQNDNAALALHVYGTDGKEKMTTSLVNIFAN